MLMPQPHMESVRGGTPTGLHASPQFSPRPVTGPGSHVTGRSLKHRPTTTGSGGENVSSMDHDENTLNDPYTGAAHLQLPLTPAVVGDSGALSTSEQAANHNLARRTADLANILNFNVLQCTDVHTLQRKLIETAEALVRLEKWYDEQQSQRAAYFRAKLHALAHHDIQVGWREAPDRVGNKRSISPAVCTAGLRVSRSAEGTSPGNPTGTRALLLRSANNSSSETSKNAGGNCRNASGTTTPVRSRSRRGPAPHRSVCDIIDDIMARNTLSSASAAVDLSAYYGSQPACHTSSSRRRVHSLKPAGSTRLGASQRSATPPLGHHPSRQHHSSGAAVRSRRCMSTGTDDSVPSSFSVTPHRLRVSKQQQHRGRPGRGSIPPRGSHQGVLRESDTVPQPAGSKWGVCATRGQPLPRQEDTS